MLCYSNGTDKYFTTPLAEQFIPVCLSLSQQWSTTAS